MCSVTCPCVVSYTENENWQNIINSATCHLPYSSPDFTRIYWCLHNINTHIEYKSKLSRGPFLFKAPPCLYCTDCTNCKVFIFTHWLSWGNKYILIKTKNNTNKYFEFVRYYKLHTQYREEPILSVKYHVFNARSLCGLRELIQFVVVRSSTCFNYKTVCHNSMNSTNTSVHYSWISFRTLFKTYIIKRLINCSLQITSLCLL